MSGELTLRLTYSSGRNITFNNSDWPDEDPLGLTREEWDEMTTEEQVKLIDNIIEEYLWELVEVYAEVLDGDDVIYE